MVIQKSFKDPFRPTDGATNWRDGPHSPAKDLDFRAAKSDPILGLLMCQRTTRQAGRARMSAQQGEQPREDMPNTPTEHRGWRYTCRSERGRVTEYSGHVTYLGGAAGERLQGELAAVLRDLLRWAATARDAAEESPKNDQGTAT